MSMRFLAVTMFLSYRVTMDFLDAAMAVSKGEAKKDI